MRITIFDGGSNVSMRYGIMPFVPCSRMTAPGPTAPSTSTRVTPRPPVRVFREVAHRGEEIGRLRPESHRARRRVLLRQHRADRGDQRDEAHQTGEDVEEQFLHGIPQVLSTFPANLAVISGAARREPGDPARSPPPRDCAATVVATPRAAVRAPAPTPRARTSAPFFVRRNPDVTTIAAAAGALDDVPESLELA